MENTIPGKGNKLERSVMEYLEEPDGERLEKVVKDATALVRHFAASFSGGNPNEDFIQAGFEGLLKALKHYDPKLGNAFSTYAGYWIMGEIRHHIRREASFYKPGCIADLQNRIELLTETVFRETGEIPTLEYISKVLNVKEEGIAEAMRAGIVSLDEIDLSKISCIRYESFKFPIEDRILLGQALKKLTDLQMNVIYLLFFKDMTQQEAAETLGLNQRKVSRVLHGGLENLKKAWQM